jgi:hypothetical protein
MLYDPKWEVEANADPLSMASLVGWLETKKPGGRYDYDDYSGRCLYGQYMASHGIKWEESGATGRHGSTQERSDFCNLVYAEVANQRPWTFGAALERAREALPSKERSGADPITSNRE